MPTDDVYTRLWSKKILPIDQFKTQFLDYLRDQGIQAVAANFRLPGPFDEEVTVQPDTGHGGNMIEIAPAVALYATDGEGAILYAAAADSRLAQVYIPFDAGAAKKYHVALTVERVEQGVEIDTVTGLYQYKEFLEQIGHIADLDDADVTDDADGTMTFNVNVLFDDDTELHTGRTIRIWLKSKDETISNLGPGPQSDSDSIAFEECTVAVDGSDNVIHTTAQFGQSGTPSTTADHYIACLIGPRVHKSGTSPDFKDTDGIVYLAEVTARPTTDEQQGGDINITDQVPIVYLFSSLADVFRTDAGSNKLKLAIKADDTDTNANQIEIRDSDDNVVFRVNVDEAEAPECTVYIDGDFEVTGTETIDINEIVLGDVEIGEDVTDTMKVWSEFYLMPGPKGGAYTDSPSIHFGDGTTDTDFSVWQAGLQWDVLAAEGTDIFIQAEAPASLVNDLWIGRNDTRATESVVVVKNKGAGGGDVSLEIEGDVTVGEGAGATGRTLKLDATVPWTLQAVTGGNVEIAVNSLSDEEVAIKNSGAGDVNLNVDGDVQSGTGLFKSLHGSAAMTLSDAILTGGIGTLPVSSSSEAGGDALGTASQTLLGAIEELRLEAASKMSYQNGVIDLDGMDVADAGGLDITVQSNGKTVLISGNRYTYGADTPLTMTASQTNYVYVNGAGTVTFTTSKVTALTMSTLLLGVVVTNVADITSISDARVGAPKLSQRLTLTVGTSNTPNNYSDFDTLTAALKWVEEWNSRMGTTKRPEIEIVITGHADMTGEYLQLTTDHSNLIIRSNQSAFSDDTQAYLELNQATFNFNGAVGIEFRDIRFSYTGASTTNWVFGGTPENVKFIRCFFTGDPSPARWFFHNTAETLHFLYCRFDSYYTVNRLVVIESANARGVIIAFCDFTDAMNGSYDWGQVKLLNCRGCIVAFCKFEGGGASGISYPGLLLEGDVASGLAEWWGSVVAMGNSLHCYSGASVSMKHGSFIGNTVNLGSEYFGIIGGPGVNISNNRFINDPSGGITGATQEAIRIDFASYTGPYEIASVNGNHIACPGFYCSSGRGGVGIKVTSASRSVNIAGNTIMVTGRAEGKGIVVSGDYCQVTGNYSRVFLNGGYPTSKIALHIEGTANETLAQNNTLIGTFTDSGSNTMKGASTTNNNNIVSPFA